MAVSPAPFKYCIFPFCINTTVSTPESYYLQFKNQKTLPVLVIHVALTVCLLKANHSIISEKLKKDRTWFITDDGSDILEFQFKAA